MRSVDTFDHLFQSLGGTSAVARAIGKGQSTASEMRRRGAIPVAYWPALIATAQEKGIALDEATLVRIHLAPAEGEVPSDQAASHAA